MIDASPLIFLANAKLLDLLRLLCDRILVPDAVSGEVRAGDADEAVRALDNVPWLESVASGPVPPEISAWKLDFGEEAVVAWAWAHPGTVAILDDFAGRSCAESLGIKVRGPLGVILTAKQRGMIAAARPLIEGLRREGMYLSDAIVERALATVGE